MALQFQWESHQGTATSKNHDYAGLTIRGSRVAVIIADGVSAKERSGYLAKSLVEKFVHLMSQHQREITPEMVLDWLRTIRSEFKRQDFGTAATAYLVAIFEGDVLKFTVHAGDCRVGSISRAGGIAWLTPIHSLATALGQLHESVLPTAIGRTQLTRTFSCRHYSIPEVRKWDMEMQAGWIIATDGFWADHLPEQQEQLCVGTLFGQNDFNIEDMSWLVLRSSTMPQNCFKTPAANLLVHHN